MLDTKKILQENLKALLETRPETSRLNLSREMKVGDGTLGSIQYGKGNPTLEVLTSIARFFHLETWQLLCPNLGSTTPAQVDASAQKKKHGHWPFTEVRLSDFNALPSEERDEIEYQIAYKIKRLKRNSVLKRKA